MPAKLAPEIAAAYDELGEAYGKEPDVAVRSSATAEDLPNASFAGQQDTYLNVRGLDALLATCRRVYASLFNDRAISYRAHHGFAHDKVGLSIGVQKMVRADIGAAGVMFTLDTETGFRDVVMINAAYGLGENVVQGAVNPDEFTVFKPTLAAGRRPVLKRHLGAKAMKMVYATDAGGTTRNVSVSEQEQRRFCLTDDEVLELAGYAVKIEEHYSAAAGRDVPMDIEWAKDGTDGKLYILQARPETVRSRESRSRYVIYHLESRGRVLASGMSVGRKIAAGQTRTIAKVSQMSRLQPGEVLVTDMTDPDWGAGDENRRRHRHQPRRAHLPRRHRRARAGHPGRGRLRQRHRGDRERRARDRELRRGDTGHVYEGLQRFRVESVTIEAGARPRTRIMMNVGNPEEAFEHSFLPNDGVGLARLEFIISRSIQVHPRALLEYERLDAEERRHVDVLTAGYRDRRDYFVRRLAGRRHHRRRVLSQAGDCASERLQIERICTAVRRRVSSLKEENPMLGLRGASRYYAESFRESFVARVRGVAYGARGHGTDEYCRDDPFARSVDWVRRVLEIARCQWAYARS